MGNKKVFCIFGFLQAILLGLIVFFVLGTTTIGKDTAILLSVLFPLFTLILEYMVYTKE